MEWGEFIKLESLFPCHHIYYVLENNVVFPPIYVFGPKLDVGPGARLLSMY